MRDLVNDVRKTSAVEDTRTSGCLCIIKVIAITGIREGQLWNHWS